MTTEEKPRWTFLWGLRGRRAGLRDAVAVPLRAVRDANVVAAARSASRALGPDHERRWGWLAPRRARRLLVVAMVPIWALVIASGVLGVSLVPGFVLSGGAYLLIRQASRQITDLPETYLDERQVGIRNESFTIAYRILAGALTVGITGSVGWLYAVEAGWDLTLPDLPVDLRLAALWVLLWAMQSLPAAVLLWREPDVDEPRPGATGTA